MSEITQKLDELTALYEKNPEIKHPAEFQQKMDELGIAK